jgi:tetratricopeptide (TPR) repeat protein
MSFTIDDNLWAQIGEYNRELGDPETALNRANFNHDNGNFKQAILDYSHYLKYITDNPLPYFFLGDCYHFTHKDELAIPNYEAGISKTKGNAPLGFLNNYGSSLMNLERYEKALQVADLMLSQNSQYAPSYLLKGQILYMLDHNDKAFYYLTRAIELNTKVWQAWATRADVNYALGDYSQADYDFKNAHVIYSDLPAGYYTKHALALYKMGRKAEAIEEFERAKILGDSDAQGFLETLLK